jgi:hypothetical protein
MRIQRPVLVYFPGSVVLSTSGSQSRANWLLKILTSYCDDLTLYSYSDGPWWEWTPQAVQQFKAEFPKVRLLLDERNFVLKQVTSLKNLLIPMFPSQLRRILNVRVPFSAPRLRRYFDENQRCILFCNFVDGVTQLNGLADKPYFIDTHDIKFVHYLKKSKVPCTALSVLRKFRGEMASLDGASGVIAISPAEEQVFRMLLSARVYYLPALPDPIRLEAKLPPLYDLSFIGSRGPLNVEGFTNFIEENDPWLRRYKVALYGQICEVESIRALCSKRPYIAARGYVSDLNEALGQTKCTISPVEGTGLKIKLVDSLARGKPVFASRQSLDGLAPGFESCVFPIREQSIRRLLDDPDALREAEIASVSYYEKFRHAGDLPLLLESLRTLGLANVEKAAPGDGKPVKVSPVVGRPQAAEEHLAP